MKNLKDVKDLIRWLGRVGYALGKLWLKSIITSILKLIFILLIASIGLVAGICAVFVETFKFIKSEIEV